MEGKFAFLAVLVGCATLVCASNPYDSLVRDVDDDLDEPCKGQPSGALVAHPHSCTKFLYCLATPAVRDCPAGLHFNPIKRVCDWPQNAGCTVKQSPLSTDQFAEKYSVIRADDDLVEACKGQPHGALVAHPHSCTKFLYCLGSSPVVRDCPAGLHFNPIKRVCDWPQNAGCTAKQSPSSTDQFAEKYSFIRADDDLVEACKGQPFGALVAHPHICTKFLYCLATPVVRDCPAGLHFNPKLRVCDWPQNAGCVAITTPSPTTTTDTEPTDTEPTVTTIEPPVPTTESNVKDF